MGSLKNWADVVVGLIVGLSGTLANINMLGFVTNIRIPYLVPDTVDLSADNSLRLLSYPLWNNLLLLVGFGLQHSGMIRGPVNSLLRLFFSKENTKVFYAATSIAYLRFVFTTWAPMPTLIWNVQQEQLRILLHVACFTSWFFVALSLLTLDPWAMIGIKAQLDKALNRPKKKVKLVTTGLYGLMRHPVYTFLMLGLSITPKMTVGHLLFSSVLLVYTLFAVAQFEEPDLVKEIGSEYKEYMRTTPRYIPNVARSFSGGAEKTAKD